LRLPELSDEELLAHLSSTGYFEELYLRHVGKITTFAARRCSTSDEIPDLVAALWLEVIASADTFDPRRGQALPWILGVAANLTASHERRRSRELEALTRLGREPVCGQDAVAELDAQMDAVMPARRALETLQRLPEAERVVAELVLVEGLTPQEAAAALNVRPATARMRLARARRKLRLSLTPFRPMTDKPSSIPEV
jgi:RNA polymerase sigma factor (sigma-70 family)